jgi:hypothetical protein
MEDSLSKISFGQYGSLLLRYLRPQKWLVLVLAVLLFANLSLQLLDPQIGGDRRLGLKALEIVSMIA